MIAEQNEIISGLGQDMANFEAESPRTEVEIANEQMHRLSQEVNESLGQKIVGPDGRLKMFMFQDVFGKEDITLNSAVVRSRKIEWAELDDPVIRDGYIRRFGLSAKAQELPPEKLTDEVLRALDHERADSPSNLAEIAATLLLHRAFGKDFSVVRTTSFDDMHGVDTIMVNNKTGEVACAFDDLLGEREGGTDQRLIEKEAKQKRATETGGAFLKYGFTVKEGRLVKQSFDHIPIFRLCLGQSEVNTILGECDQYDNGVGPASQNILGKLVDSLGTQTGEYLASNTLPHTMRQKLEQYRDGSLAEMRAMVETDATTKIAA